MVVGAGADAWAGGKGSNEGGGLMCACRSSTLGEAGILPSVGALAAEAEDDPSGSSYAAGTVAKLLVVGETWYGKTEDEPVECPLSDLESTLFLLPTVPVPCSSCCSSWSRCSSSTPSRTSSLPCPSTSRSSSMTSPSSSVSSVVLIPIASSSLPISNNANDIRFNCDSLNTDNIDLRCLGARPIARTLTLCLTGSALGGSMGVGGAGGRDLMSMEGGSGGGEVGTGGCGGKFKLNEEDGECRVYFFFCPPVPTGLVMEGG